MNFDRIKYFYEAGLWSKPMVKVAVKKGIIKKTSIRKSQTKIILRVNFRSIIHMI